MDPLTSQMATPVCCSKCDRETPRLYGTCSTCPDGDALCEICSNRHVRREAKYSAHTFTAINEPTTASDLLAKLLLISTPAVCKKHGLKFSGLVCKQCVNVHDFEGGICTECIILHSTAFPSHALTPSTHNIASTRLILSEAASTPVEGCYASSTSIAGAPGGAASSNASSKDVTECSLVLCGRHKAVAVQSTLDTLDSNEEAAIRRVEAAGEAIVAEALSLVRSVSDEVRAAAATKRAQLQYACVAADHALEGAIKATDILTEVRS